MLQKGADSGGSEKTIPSNISWRIVVDQKCFGTHVLLWLDKKGWLVGEVKVCEQLLWLTLKDLEL